MDKKPDEIYCTKCGAKLPSDADYCTKCGVQVTELKMSTDPGPTNIVQEKDPVEKASSEAKIMDKKPYEIYCPNCAKPINKDAVVCPNCGVQVKEPKVSNDAGSTNIAQEKDPVEKASGEAKSWLIWSIVGFFICGIVLGPLSIANASRIKKVLKPDDPGYGKAVAAQIIGWVDVVAWVIGIIISFASR
jgi:uncharacterized membrane protein YvbJ